MKLMIQAIATSFLLLASNIMAEEDKGKRAFDEVCRACHQLNGHGIPEMKAPAIAGLPRWYVSHQLRQFSSGQRGGSAADKTGQLMTKMVQGLDDVTIALLGRYIQKHLSPLQQRQTLPSVSKKDLIKGQRLYDKNCGSCHGKKATGDRSKFVPPLNRQQDWYLLNQIEKFTIGARQHPVLGKKVNLDYPSYTKMTAYLTTLD